MKIDYLSKMIERIAPHILGLNEVIVNMYMELSIQAEIVKQRRLFVSTWKKFLKSDIEPKINIFMEVSDKLRDEIVETLNSLSILKDQHHITDINEYINKINELQDKFDQIGDEVIKMENIFDKIWKSFDEEAEIPVFPELPVIKLTKIIDPKEYDKWMDSV